MIYQHITILCRFQNLIKFKKITKSKVRPFQFLKMFLISRFYGIKILCKIKRAFSFTQCDWNQFLKLGGPTTYFSLTNDPSSKTGYILLHIVTQLYENFISSLIIFTGASVVILKETKSNDAIV